jgi:SAM-dependent methyltransferase
MRWLLKASFQKALSSLPASHELNYVLQRRVMRTLPGGRASLLRKFTRAKTHHDAFLAHGGSGKPEATFYEFGAGWDLAVPLSYYALGVDRQTLVDIHTNVRLELVGHVLEQLRSEKPELERIAGRPVRLPESAGLTAVADLEHRFGIRYLAPCDARGTGLPPESFDFISSTNTFEHIPEVDVGLVLAECRRLLRPDGIMSARIDLQDHYSYVDRNVSRYNYLRFSERAWRLANSSVHFQNRLRYPDYVRLAREAGLEVVSETLSSPSAEDLETLRAITLGPRFKGRYSLEELGVKTVTLVARPVTTDPARAR